MSREALRVVSVLAALIAGPATGQPASAPARPSIGPLLAAQISGLAVDRRQTRLALDVRRGIAILDNATGQVSRLTTVARGSRPEQLALGDDGRLLAVSYLLSQKVYVVDVARNALLAALAIEDVESVAFSPDGRQLATGLGNGPTIIWDLASRARVRTLRPKVKSNVIAVRFSPDGKRVIVGSVVAPRTIGRRSSYDGAVKIWDVATGRELRSLGGQESALTALELSPDGAMLATAALDGIVLRRLPRGQKLRTLDGHRRHAIERLRFSPDGKVLASAGTDNGIHLWDPGSGAELRRLQGSGH